MQPGWYSHIQEPKAVAHFDGTSWGPLTDRFSLPLDVQLTVTRLNPRHLGPRAPFETTEVVRKSKPGSGWWWGISIGAILILCGLARSFMSASRWSPGVAISVWVLILLGLLIVLASAIIMAVLRSGQTNRVVTSAPTLASQIEDLARLRDKGLVTPEEFEWKRQELLRRS